jgi:hypothetical protein
MSLLTFSQQRVGQGYASGKVDCFHLVYDYLLELGAEIPSTYRGLSLETYYDLFISDPLRAQITMIEFFEEYLDEIYPQYHLAGDILLVSYEDTKFVGIDAGNGKILTVAVEIGVNVSSLRFYKIERVFRWVKY